MTTGLRSRTRTAHRIEWASPSPLARVLDFVSDWGVAGFATWTLLSYLATLTHTPVMPIAAVWLCLMPLVALALLRLRAPTATAPSRTGPIGRHAARIPHVTWPATAVLCAAAAGALAASRDDHTWVAPWLFAIVAVGVAACAAGRRAPRDERPHRYADLVAAGFALALAALSLMVFSTDGDDAFYVNRAVAVAQLNVVPTQDVIFTDQAVPPIAGTGLPLDALAVLQGALARLVDLQAASIAYYLTPPIGTFLAVWALWRLLRSWAPRRALVCLLLAGVYLLFSGAEPYGFGNFHLTRMWQGKVVFVAWLVPVFYTYLTAWATRRNVRTGVLLLAGGVAGLGLTASATFAVPLVMAAGAVPLLLRREWRALAVPVAALAFPLVTGFIATRCYPVAAASTGPHPVWDLYRDSMGFGIVGAVGGLALWAGPWLARSGVPTRVVTGIGVVTVLLLTPGLFTLITETQGLGETLWRTFWMVPGPALVGLLAAIPVPNVAAWPGLVPGGAAAALLIVTGQPIWHVNEVHPIARPVWKVPPAHLRQARDILARYDGPGPVLAPPQTMSAISLLTVRTKAVNPRAWYARILPDKPSRTRDRLALTWLTEGDIPWSHPGRIQAALTDLNVRLVCVRSYRQHVIHFVEHLAPYRYGFRAPGSDGWHSLICLHPPESWPSA